MKTPTPRAFLFYFSSHSNHVLRPYSLFPHSRICSDLQQRTTESFSTSSSASSSSSCSFHSSSSSSWSQRNVEESKAVKVTVWWDIENCTIPSSVSPYRVTHRITSALRSQGIKGPVTITAFGNLLQLNHATQDALCTSGVCLTHVPNCGKNSADRFILADLVYWVARNPPPAHFFLISGDRDFANILHKLRMNNYNILIASSDGASSALCSAATIMWPWNELVRGENLNGKHFNHPPDGLYASWYGHYKGALDDPFSDGEEATCPLPEESTKPVADFRIRRIPKVVVNKISQILSSNPEGITATNLFKELKKSNVVLDKDFFGYKKFTNLISAMCNTAKFKPDPLIEGRFLVHSAHDRSMDPVQHSLKPAIDGRLNHGDGHQFRTAETDGSLFLPVSEPTVEEPSHARNERPAISASQPSPGNHSLIGVKNGKSSHLAGQTTANLPAFPHKDPDGVTAHKDNIDASSKDISGDTGIGRSSSVQEDGAAVKEGFLQGIWRSWACSEPQAKETKIASVGESANCESSCQTFLPNNRSIKEYEEIAPTRKSFPSNRFQSDWLGSSVSGEKVHVGGSTYVDAKSTKGKVYCDSQCSSSSSTATSPSMPEDRTSRHAEENGDKSNLKSGFLGRISSWCKFWGKGAKVNGNVSASTDEVISIQCNDEQKVQCKDTEHLILKPKSHYLFSRAYLWPSMESFLCTSKGSELVTKSMSRKHLVQRLQKEAPRFLNTLEECHLLQVVELLISEKKWVEECSSQTFPFKLAFPAKRTCVPSRPCGSDGLGHVFSSGVSQSNSETMQERVDQDQKSCSAASSSNRTLETKPPKNMVELRSWYHKISEGNGNLEVRDLKKHFEREFGRKLDSLSYGYFTVENLLAACAANNISNQVKDKKSSQLSRKEMLADCKNLVTKALEENPAGFLTKALKPMFMEKYGYDLDHRKLGYPKLASLLKIMPGVRVESGMILPAQKCHPSSITQKPAAHRNLESSLESEKCSDDEECSWEELGPLNETGISENKNSKNELEEQVELDDESLSEEDSTDSEGTFTNGSYELESQGKQKKNQEESSLVQILNSWHNSQDGREKNQLQATEGLVDCSGSNSPEPIEPKLSSMFRLKRSKSYSFVSDTGEQKDRVASDILHVLKKVQESKL